jgi:hypothetical protein
LYGLRIHAVDGEAFTDLRHDNYTQAFRFYDFEGADGLTMTGFVRVLPAVKTAGLPVGYQDAAGIESYSGGPAGQLSADGHRSARPATRLIADVPTNGRYWARLSLFDPRENIGPVSVWMNGLCVARNVRERRGKVREILSEAVTVTAGRVEIDLVNGGNSVWGVCGLEMGEEWPTNMPSNWVAGQPTTLAIGVKAGEFDLSGGAIRITVPDGLPAPTVDNPGAAGYVRALCPDGVTVSGIRVSGREITLTMGAFAAGRLVEVLFGDRSGGGPGAVAGAVGDYSFAVRVSGAGGSLLPAMAPGQDPATATGAASGYCREAGGPNTEEWPGYQLHDNDPREIPFACPEPYFPLTTVGDDCRFRMMVIGEECALASLLNVKVYCEKRDGTPWEAKAFDLMTTGQPGQRVTSKKIIVHDGAVKEATKRYFEEQGYELLLGDGGDPITTRVYRRSLD